MYAGHRDSFDHDHVLVDLVDRYEQVLDAVEAADGWATSVRATKPPFTIMGSLDGIEAGLRQMRRTRPLETTVVDLGDGLTVVAPTEAEALRVKGYLVVQRNMVRDYLDVAALSEHLRHDAAAAILAAIDEYYDDRSHTSGSVVTSLALALADPSPRDTTAVSYTHLDVYKRQALTHEHDHPGAAPLGLTGAHLANSGRGGKSP